MMRMTSHPGQWLLAGSLRRSLYQLITAILRQLGGCNQGPAGLDYWCTGISGAQRSGYSLFTVTYVCQILQYSFMSVTGLTSENFALEFFAHFTTHFMNSFTRSDINLVRSNNRLSHRVITLTCAHWQYSS